MFTKQKKVGQGRYEVRQTVTDWDAVFGVAFLVMVALVFLKACSG